MIYTQLLLSLLIATSLSAVVVNPLSGVSDNNLVYSGSLPISDTAKSTLFFTYYGINGEKSQQNLQKHPLIAFVGNLGSSAQYMNLGGLGPIKINEDLSLQINEYSANAYSNTMFVDLLGSGFSFAATGEQIPSTESTYAIQLTYALNAFTKQSPLGKSPSIIIVGEGTFVRSMTGLDDIPNLKLIVHLGYWPQLYVVGKYAGVAGVELGIFGNGQKITIESSFSTCYTNLRNQKYAEARQCYNNVLNYASDKSKNTNLFNVALKQNLTDFLPIIQYYFSQSSIVSKFKAPQSIIFEGQSNQVFYNTYVEQAKNYTKQISTFTKDYLDVRHLFVVGSNDYISYKKGSRSWLQDEVSFVERAQFKKLDLQDVIINGQKVGVSKATKQVAYYELLNCGHYALHDQTRVMNQIIRKSIDSNLNHQAYHLTSGTVYQNVQLIQ